MYRPASSLAIDLGSTNTLLSTPERGLVLAEPSAVTLTHHAGVTSAIAAGFDAANMDGRTGSVVWPVRRGMVEDAVAATLMVKALVQKAFGKRARFSRVLVSAPRDASDVERRAFRQIGESLGPAEVLLTYEPVAAAVGAGLDVLKPRGRMLVDVGSGITEAVVLSMGHVVSYHALREGGETVNERIIEHMRWAQHLRIGTATAERVKLAAAAALWTGSQRPLTVRGTSTETRLPAAALVTPAELKTAFESLISMVADCIEAALGQADPHLATDICEDGIWLSGGSLLVPGAAHALSERLHTIVRRVADPLRMVAVGNGKLLASDSLYRATAVS